MTKHPASHRGHHLLTAGKRFSTGGVLALAAAPLARRLLDRIDQGLERGSISVRLPGGSKRLLGRRTAGPEAVVILNSWRALARLATGGSVGWFRAWMEGEWDSPDPVALFELFVVNRDTLGGAGRASGAGRLVNRLLHGLRNNSHGRARRNIGFHYDLGNDFYQAWLDETQTYSSALFAEPVSSAEPLEAAQTRKVRALLDRLNLKPGDRLLEIGCGWGYLAEVAARDYGVHVHGITLSQEQLAFARERISRAGLADRVALSLTDYRDLTGQYDAVTSVEMVEAVGEEYWPAFLKAVTQALKPGGRAALQLISIDDAIYESYARNADFIQTYIFPGGMLISEERFSAIAAGQGLLWHDRRGLAPHYVETLKRWRARFDAAVAEGRFPTGFDERFHRLWRYYLMYCEGGFRGGGIDVVQVTLVKGRGLSGVRWCVQALGA